MRSVLRISSLAACLLLVLLVATSAGAREYVSLMGKFYFSYPDDWQQVDYKEVNRTLREMQAGESMLDYDAVLAPEGQTPFHSGPYAIITVDTTGEFSQQRIDSVLNELSQMFRKDARYFPIGDFMANLKAESPTYDRDEKIVSVLNTITQQGESFKKNLILFKFYERGVVTLYCYSPDSLFESTVGTFIDMARSISTESYDAHLPKEQVTVADLENRDLASKDPDVGPGSSVLIWVIIGAVIIAILFLIQRRKKQSSQS